MLLRVHPRSPVVAFTLLAVLATPSAPAVEGSSKGPTSTPSSVGLVSAYAEDHRVSEAEAKQRLGVQARAGRMLPALRLALGESFAGMWIAPDTGRVGVGSLMNEPEVSAVIKQTLTKHDLLDDADIEQVTTSTADLQAAQYTVGIELRSAIDGQRVTSQVDDAANRITIIVSPSASRDDRARIEHLDNDFARGRSAYGPPLPPADGAYVTNPSSPPSPQPARRRVVDINVVEGPDQVIEPTVNCSSESCSPPLRAGVKIVNNGDDRRCSAGYIGAWWSGSGYEYFTMTAGHCVKGTNSNWHWRAYNPDTGSSNNIGQPWTWRFGANYGNVYSGLSLDIGIIHINPGGYWGTSITNALWMHGWPNGVLWSVTSQTIAYQGEYGCRTGYASAYTCGTISSVNGTVGYGDGEGGVTNLLFIPGACPVSGDSGGAFSDGGAALGITSGRASHDDGSCAFGIFAHAEDVGNWLGVWALT